MISLFGLMERDLQYIIKALRQFEEIESAILFGSRAMGNYKRGSDVDLAIKGEKVSDRVMYELDDLLNEVYPIPYFFDLLHYEKIKSKALIEHIDHEGKELYRKGQ